MRRTGGGWNKGVKVGKKRPFTPDQVMLIRAALTAKQDLRGLALFEVSMSVMLRASDILSLKVGDVQRTDVIVTDIEVEQKKTGGAVKVSLSERARSAIRTYLASRHVHGLNPHPDQALWVHKGLRMTRQRYAALVKEWALLAHADPKAYSTHSMRRTLPKHVYSETRDIETVRQLLGHASVASTSSYLDIDRDQALATKKKFEL